MTRKPDPKSQSGNQGSSDDHDADEASDVIVFVEEKRDNGSSIGHAQRVARAFGGKVVLVHVQRQPHKGAGPVDPVEWDIRKQQTLKWLGKLVRSAGEDDPPCEAKLLEGHCGNQIQSFLEQHRGDIAGALRYRGDSAWNLSEVAASVLSSRSAGVLMIPQEAELESGKSYNRILVPLDGSTRGEIALPSAVILALAENAELVLFYVAPEPGVTEFEVKDQDAERLHTLVCQRNEKAGRSYLTRIKNRLAQNGLKITTRVCGSGDARRALIDAVGREKADFVVMTTHGQSGHMDVPTGDVARFVLDRADIPVLLVRHLNGPNGNHVFGNLASKGVRQPVGTD